MLPRSPVTAQLSRAGALRGTLRRESARDADALQSGTKFDPDTWKVDAAPQHGRLQFDGGRVEYVPNADYVGADAFTVTTFGSNPMMRGTMRRRNGQFEFDIVARRTAP